jgi:hypothetical protein
MIKNLLIPFFVLTLFINCTFAQSESETLLTFPLQWEFSLPKQTLILTSDRQLEDLMDPDKKINTSLGIEQHYESLREFREKSRKRGCRTVNFAFDNFFRQYRKDAGDERKLYPDMDEYIRKISKISKFMGEYGIGLDLSLLSPLELGPAFIRYGGEPGRWVHYKTGLRDPQSGAFSVELWQQLAWSNNKGKINLKRSGVRAFAFKEKRLPGGSYYVVKPEDIIEITSRIEIEEFPGTESPQSAGYRKKRIRIYHNGDGQLKGYDRVFIILSYQTPEMDYFSSKALPFLKQLLRKYYDAGINLNGLYSDEMHIQQDWGYFSHHDNGQLALRFLSKNMADEYARRYGGQYRNMEKYMLYFVYGPKPYLNTTRACRNSQIVMGDTPEAIHQTFLFRDRYYKLLTNTVVDLFVNAKHYAEKLYSKDLLSRAHATWAQSPTIDDWAMGLENSTRYKYEYTPNFVWSNTVHQAAAACYDYFKWGEYLTGNGTDHPEGGWSDRNYYGSALACSFGIINKYPNAYNGFWGMPAPVRERIYAIVSAFGANASPTIKAVTDNVHRDVDVLMLYPMNLVATEERFGSWLTQYGYTNYITAEKLLELGKVTEDGKIVMAGRTFSTLVSQFEILPRPRLLKMMRELAEKGGTVIWSGAPPLINADGQNCESEWQDIFGVKYKQALFQGKMAGGKTVVFQNSLTKVPQQVILTDFIMDRIYPVKIGSDCEVIAMADKDTVGSLRRVGKGTVCYLGFRPRDDQAASLGREQRVWFEILNTLGAYPASGHFAGINDNTEYLSRTTDYLCTRFPNGATIIARHYRRHPESWPGGFSRDVKQDEEIIRKNPLPTDTIQLKNFKVNRHEVSYDGRLIMAFNTDKQGNLSAFEGHNSDRVTVDGKTYIFSDKKQRRIAWAPVAQERRLPGKAFLQIFVSDAGEVTIPLQTDKKNLKLYKEGQTPGSRGEEISFSYSRGQLRINIDKSQSGRWLYLTGE